MGVEARLTGEAADKMGGSRAILLLLLRISTGACMEWKGHFLKPSYQGQLVIQETVDGDYNFDIMFGSSSKMVGELDNFTRNLTDQAYSLLLSSSPCGEKWEKRQLGFLEANETIEGVDDMAVAQSVRLLHCPEEPCLLLVDELDCAVIVICIPIIYCCIKSRSNRKKKFDFGEDEAERDSIDDPFLDNRHTKSELSIPYMDASLPPTPKGGRSGFRLADLLGNNNKGSDTSLSERPI